MNSLEAYELISAGVNMSESDISQAEKTLLVAPSDIVTRVKVLAYYDRRKYRNPEAKIRRIFHIGWFIDNAQTFDFLDDCGHVIRDFDGRAAYLDLANRYRNRLTSDGKNTSLLKNAASFFTLDDRIAAENCLQTGKKLEPNDPDWSSKLSQLYKLWGTGFEEAALSECLRAVELSDEDSKTYYFTDLPELAYLAGKYELSAEYAQQLLQFGKEDEDWNYGNTVNSAHTFLGLIALKNCDLNAAKLHLKHSTQGASSPQNDSFGPERLLAAELIEVGEVEAVMDFFNLCETFWDSGKNSMQKWRDEIRAGMNPFNYLLQKNQAFYDHIRLPRNFYNHQKWELAKSSSENLLLIAGNHIEDEKHYGFAVHVANVVLGQLALKDENVEEAKRNLKIAGAVAHSDRLANHGPDLSLCADLAKLGEIDAIAGFFSTMACYWTSRNPEPDLANFLREAKEGKLHPDLLW